MDNIGFDNLDSLLSKIENISELKSLKKGIEKACIRVEADAKKNCPVDDGILRASITHEVEENQGTVGSNVEYAPYVELGTGLYASSGMGRKTPWSYIDIKTGKRIWTAGQSPQPYLYPALSDNKTKIQQDIKNEVKTELRGLCK